MRIWFLALIILFSGQSWGANFKVGNLQGWKKQNLGTKSEVYSKLNSKNRETVVLSVSEKTNTDAEHLTVLTSKLEKLYDARGQVLSKFGYGSYKIYYAKSFLKGRAGFEIHSRFKSPKGRTIQTVERRYFIGSKIYQVTISQDSTEPIPQDHIKKILGNFTPVSLVKSRMPADEMAAASFGQDQGQEIKLPADNKTWELKPAELEKSPLCAHIPKEIRVKAADGEVNPDTVLGSSWGCLQGAGDLLAATWELVVSSWQFTFDAAYRDQVMATWKLLEAERAKDPDTFTMRVFEALRQFLVQAINDFPCYNSEMQSRMVCSSISVALKPVIMAKIMSRVALTAEELNSVIKGARMAATVKKVTEDAITTLTKSPKVVMYDEAGAMAHKVIEPNGSYTVLVMDGKLILGKNIPGAHDQLPGGKGSHKTLRDMSGAKGDFLGKAGSIRFHEDGTIDVSGYHAKMPSPAATTEIAEMLREIVPDANIRMTADRLSTLDGIPH